MQNTYDDNANMDVFKKYAEEWDDLMSVYPKAPNSGAFQAYLVAIKGGFSPSVIYRAAKYYRDEVQGKHSSKIKQLTNFLNPGPDQYLYWYKKQIDSVNEKAKQEQACLICGHKQVFGTSIICSFCGCPGGDPDTDQATIDYWQKIHKEQLNGGSRRSAEIPQGWNQIIQTILAKKSKRRGQHLEAVTQIDRILDGD